jgi:hypothetical protein
VQDLGILDELAKLTALVVPTQLQNVPKRVVRKPKTAAKDVEIRRSSRDRPKVQYTPYKRSPYKGRSLLNGILGRRRPESFERGSYPIRG